MEQKTSVRSICFPVYPPSGMDWKGFYEILKEAWTMSTKLANWSIRVLMENDVLPKPDDKRMPPFPKGFSLYAHWNKHFLFREDWEGMAQSANCIMRSVDKKYRGKLTDGTNVPYRAALYQHCSVSPMHFRFPYPFLVHNQTWKLDWSGERPVIDIPFPVGRLSVNVRCGPEFRRQLRSLKQIHDGNAKKGELAIYKAGKHTMLKVVGTFPVEVKHERIYTLLVRTDPNALLVADVDGRNNPWIYNADHIRRQLAAHTVFRQRMSEDKKMERRTSKERKGMNSHLDTRCQKMRNRVNDQMKKVARSLVNFAVRQQIGTMIYDDADKSYLESFPYFEMKTRIKDLCHEFDIKFVSKEKGE